eukprot:767326-Hanusia_phi.AAC.2
MAHPIHGDEKRDDDDDGDGDGDGDDGDDGDDDDDGDASDGDDGGGDGDDGDDGDDDDDGDDGDDDRIGWWWYPWQDDDDMMLISSDDDDDKEEEEDGDDDGDMERGKIPENEDVMMIPRGSRVEAVLLSVLPQAHSVNSLLSYSPSQPTHLHYPAACSMSTRELGCEQLPLPSSLPPLLPSPPPSSFVLALPLPSPSSSLRLLAEQPCPRWKLLSCPAITPSEQRKKKQGAEGIRVKRRRRRRRRR